jgi:hypothetical protein
MKPLRALFVLLFAGFAVASTPAAQRGDFSMEVLVDGRPLAEHAARGRTYVEALEGREYAVRLANLTGGRVAVALAVDGLNSIDARTTTAAAARKWILGPYETITLEGWQTSLGTARRFYFTSEQDSYGEWLGRADNLGIISAAFFREKRREPVSIDERERRQEKGAPSAPEPQSSREGARSEASGDARADEHAATGIGREVGHEVREVRFEAESSAAAVLDIRYEYRDALVRLGVLPRSDDPLARREDARGFTDSGFAPDPYRGRD